MPYTYNHAESTSRLTSRPRTMTNSSSASSTSSSRSRSPKQENSSLGSDRAAGLHDFVVANMFGPVDWDVELAPPPADSGVAAENAVTSVELWEQRQCVREKESNMFGPTDWIAEAEMRIAAAAGTE